MKSGNRGSELRAVARCVVRRAMRHGAAQGWRSGALLAGCLLLPLRQGWRMPVASLWPLAGLPIGLAALGALRAWRRHRFSAASAAALLDARLHCGGLLVAQGMPGWDEWQHAIPASTPIAIRSRRPRLWPTALLATLFALAAGFWPHRPPHPSGPRHMELGADLERLREQAALLAEAVPDDPDETQEWIEQIERLAEAARSDAPAETWDALDLISARLQEQAAEAAESALHEIQQFQHMADLAEALQQMAESAAVSGDPSDLLQQLAEALERQAARQSVPLTEDMQEALRQAMNGARFDRAALQDLCDSLQGTMDDLSARMDRWAEARLIDDETLAALADLQNDTAGMEEEREGAGAGDTACAGGDACAAGDACAGGAACADQARRLLAGLAGAGGMGRGPSPAALIIGEQTDETGVGTLDLAVASRPTLGEDPLPLQGVSAVAPTVDPQAPAATGRLDATEGHAGAAQRRPVLPRHRRAVAGFFER